jgi:hydroxymethylbilane synthase
LAGKSKRIIVGTRGSQLALWQARWIMRRLRRLFPECEIDECIIKTTGDIQRSRPLAAIGGKGLFTKELDEALLDGRIDLAVHSLKDYPVELPEGLTLAAAPVRAAPHDALVSANHSTLAALPEGAVVGTGSLRRIAQLSAHRPDLRCRGIRGNLDTRLRKLDEGRYDAIMLATAGLRRLGWGSRISQLIPLAVMLPAVGQGALAVVSRTKESAQERARWRALNVPAVETAVRAERALLAALGGGCHTPIGAYGRLRNGRLLLDAVVADPQGRRLVRDRWRGDPAHPELAGRELAARLIDQGAGEILEAHET